MPSLRGVIDRRILVNFRIDADAATAVLPTPFEPRTVDGDAIGGICLLRLTDVRPRGLPAAVGVRSENAAHRIGVHWDDDGRRRDGLPESSVFDSVEAASAYHRRGATGFSPSPDGTRFAGIELDTFEWSVTPLSVESVGASYFESDRFPADAVTFDNALLMEGIDHEWHSVEGICPSAPS